MLYTKDLYKVKLKHYTNSIQFTLMPRFSRSLRKKHSSKNQIQSCSISRSISLIKEICLCNEFDYFFTLTLKDYSFRTDNLLSCDFLLKHIKHYAKLARGRGIEFKYILVFEKQKKGGIHLHGYFSGFFDLYTNKNGYLSSIYFDNIGYQNFTIAHEVNPFYLIKYMTKEPIKDIPHLFYRSRGLKKAEVSYLNDNFNEYLNFPFTFENNFCRIITITK